MATRSFVQFLEDLVQLPLEKQYINLHFYDNENDTKDIVLKGHYPFSLRL